MINSSSLTLTVEVSPMYYCENLFNRSSRIARGLSAILCCCGAGISRHSRIWTMIQELNRHFFHADLPDITVATKGRDMRDFLHTSHFFQYFHRVQGIHISPLHASPYSKWGRL